MAEVRKEGSEGGKEEGGEVARQRGDELSEAERVDKLRLVPSEAGEAGQLWKPGGRALQVSGRYSLTPVTHHATPLPLSKSPSFICSTSI